MRIIRPASNALADILLLCSALDCYTDPYRHIRDLTVEVAFTEYIDFVLQVLVTENFMFLNTAKLKALANKTLDGDKNSEHMLYKAYVLDVCAAGLKELVLAHRAESEATVIMYTPPYGASLLPVSSFAPMNSKVFYDYVWRLRILGYDTPQNMIENNRKKFIFYIHSIRAALSQYNGFFRVEAIL